MENITMKYITKWITVMTCCAVVVFFIESRLPLTKDDLKIDKSPEEELDREDTITLSDESLTDRWLKRRKESLANSSHKKVLLFCYMRGGSTFFSELFRQNTEVLYWYEPFDAFYSAKYGLRLWHFPQHVFWQHNKEYGPVLRDIPLWEKEAIAEHNHNLLSCNTESLPTESLVHNGMTKSNLLDYLHCVKNVNFFYSCLNKIANYCCEGKQDLLKTKCAESIQKSNNLIFNQIGSASVHSLSNMNNFTLFNNYSRCCYNYRTKYITPCLSRLKEQYDQTKMVAYKGLRLTMDSVEYMLEKDPDMYVLYFVRDPRSTVTSRVQISHTHRLTGNKPVKEARYHCDKLLKDYRKYQELNRKFPGAIKLIKYEDVTLNTQHNSLEIYNFLGMNVHESVYKWIELSKNSNTSGDVFSTVRKNSTASISKWREKNSISVQNGMTELCMDVLKLLGYQI